MALLGVAIAATATAIAPHMADVATAYQQEPLEVSLRSLDTRSELYDKNGDLIWRFATDGSNRELVKLEDMSDEVVQSIIAIEDSDFYIHKGINLRATFRAAVENVGAGGISQGGSTITQQLVKNLVLTDAQSLERKMQEAAIAWRLENEREKDEILEMYLNTVYFGSGAYGVEAAANVYFGKSASDLDWPEGALLASLISNPSANDPLVNPSTSEFQRDLVLKRLAKLELITEDEARFFTRLPLPQEKNSKEDLPPEDYFVAEVRRNLLDGVPTPILGNTTEEREFALFRGGLRIFTTYDRDAQAAALNARDTVLPENDLGISMAIASVEPETGAVRALVGGPGFEDYKFNLATQSKRQPGSSFKTFVMITAFEQGFLPSDTISGIGPCNFDNPGGAPNPYTVNNFGNSAGGIDTITRQTTRSSNCTYVRLGQIVGISEIIDTSRRLGLTTELGANISLPLGVEEVRPIEIASAYGVIANQGVRNPPYLIERIEDATGNVLWDHSEDDAFRPERVLTEQVSCLATQVLATNVQAGTGTRARLPEQPAAGKTGTTENFSDAWFVGFTPHLATAVWVGNPASRVQMRGVGGINVTGGSYPAQAWGEFNTAYHEDLTPLNFPECDPNERGGKLIRPDGELGDVDPCAGTPDFPFPVDEDGDGRADQCYATPEAFGYGICGYLDAVDGFGNPVPQYCGDPNAQLPGSGTGEIPGQPPPQQQQAVGCPGGYNAVDNNGDGVADECIFAGTVTAPPAVAPPPPPPPPPVPQGAGQPLCPADYPVGVDTNGDGVIDQCYQA